MIYLDNAATSKVFLEIREEMNRFLCEEFFNPSALYGASLVVKNALEQARATISELLRCQKDEIFFTSCATESNNWVLNSGRKYKRGNVVTTMGEHPSVFETASELKNKGVDVRFAKLNSIGTVDETDLLSKIDAETALVSLIHCSNETGAVNDLKKIVPLIRKIAPRALIHSDGVQAFCKIETPLRDLDIDFYSLSAHKVGGAKGVGALYINKKYSIAPLLYGGGQERGARSGTENTAGIIAFARASQLYYDLARRANIKQMRDHISSAFASIDGVLINGDAPNHSNYILSASIFGIRGEILQHMLSDEGILIGLGSACSAKSKQNRVLSALGRTGKEIEGSIRISLSVQNTMEEIKHATTIITQKILELRGRING